MEIKYGVLYIDCEEYNVNLVDYYYKILKSKSYERRFEWNLVKSEIWKRACVDMDGVLCDDPPRSVEDHTKEYLNFLKNTKPFLVPKETIFKIVTGRHQRYRLETELWLKRNGIKYRELVMSSNSDHENDGKMKAKVYKNTNSTMFIESSSNQARTISRLTNKPVLCIENMIVY